MVGVNKHNNQDEKKKQAYIEYANGERKYAE